MSDAPTRVFLLDDHEIVRRGVAELVEREDDLTVVGEAGGVAEALRRIPETRPQVAVLDVQLADGSGMEVCREIRSSHPEIACLMLTSYADDAAMLEAVMAGASGHVLKRIRGSDLVQSIRMAATGRSLLDADLIARATERLRSASEEDALISTLTGQERKILVCSRTA